MGLIRCACIVTLSLRWAAAQAQQPVAETAPAALLARDDAVHYALQYNPALMTVRKQLGFAEAAIVLARTYPFNPVYTGYVTGTGGPASAAITNRVYTEDYVTLEIELRGQGRIRRTGAEATRMRIEAEVSQQEIAVSVAVIRAYNAALYRQRKLGFVEDGIKVNEFQVGRLSKGADAGTVKQSDLMLAKADLASVRAQSGQARTALAVARSELRKLLGTLDDSFGVFGELDTALTTTDQNALTQLALNVRPDLQARKAAVCEAEAACKLVEANRYGNPTVGPFFEYDPTRITYVGGRLSMPLAIFNTKRGELLKAQTEVSKVRSEVQQMELQISQDVFAALSRLSDAGKWADAYKTDVLPNLGMTKVALEKLFAGNDPNVDLGRYLAVQRAYLKAAESLLDAQYEISQAQADLAQAVAEPALVLAGENKKGH